MNKIEKPDSPRDRARFKLHSAARQFFYAQSALNKVKDKEAPDEAKLAKKTKKYDGKRDALYKAAIAFAGVADQKNEVTTEAGYGIEVR